MSKYYSLHSLSYFHDYSIFNVLVKPWTNAARSPAPVSYTHLDVYKRQLVQIIGAVVDADFSQAETLPALLNALEVDYEVDGKRKTLAVSYTHLL